MQTLRCETTFLADAAEDPLSPRGNHNGLCEVDEDCLTSPNVGSYQGHNVTPRTLGQFPVGPALGSGTLSRFEVNGY